MLNPNISIIIPVYNVDNAYLTQCMESVLIQKGADFEVIMVDDGSDNCCSEWCDDWAMKDSRIRVIHKENGGVSSARNVGMSKARGEYLIFLDPDDWWEPDIIEKSYDVISKYNYDILFFGFYEEYPNRQLLRLCDENTGKHYQADECLIRNMKLGVMDDTVREFKAIFGTCWCSIIRKSMVTDNGVLFPEDIFHGEDSVFILKLLGAADKVGILDLALYHYRYNMESVCKKFILQLEINHERVLESFYQVLTSLHDDMDFKDAYTYSAAFKYCVVLMQDYFHMDNKEKLRDKKKRWEALAKNSLFADILRNADYKMLFRKSPAYCAVTYFTFKHRCFSVVALLSILGRMRLNARIRR